MVQYKVFSTAIVIGLGLLTSACGGPLNKDAKNQIKERVSEKIYLSFPDEDSRKTYKDWATRKSTGGIIGTAYSHRSNYDQSSGIYKFLKGHDLVFTRSVTPPSRYNNASYEFTFFKPRIKHLIKDEQTRSNTFSQGSSYNIPVGIRNFGSIKKVKLQNEVTFGGLKVKEYEFTFDYKLESIHDLFEAPCDKYTGTGTIGHVEGQGWELDSVYYGDDGVNELTKEQECRSGKAFDFPESNFSKKDYEAVREHWSNKVEIQITNDNNFMSGGPISEVLIENADKLRNSLSDADLTFRKNDKVFESQIPTLEVFPSGSVHITTGVLPVLETEDGLAAAIAHGLGHIIAGHDVDRMKAKGLSPLDRDLALETSPTDVMNALGVGSQYKEVELQLEVYSASQELEADKYAIELLSQACYHVSDAMSVFEKLQNSRFGHYTDQHPIDQNRRDKWKSLEGIAAHCN